MLTSGVANFSTYRVSLCTQSIGVLSPKSDIVVTAKLDNGCNGSSLISLPATIGIYSSRRVVSNLAIRVLACPLSPSNSMLCRDSIARSISGKTVSSKPYIPSNTFSLPSNLLIRFSLSSSLMLLLLYPDFLSAPKVFIFLISISFSIFSFSCYSYNP